MTTHAAIVDLATSPTLDEAVLEDPMHADVRAADLPTRGQTSDRIPP